VGGLALLGSVLGGGAGVLLARGLSLDPVPSAGVLGAVGGGVLVAVVVLAVVAVVLVLGARAPLAAALRELRSAR
jgi:hypothetical protein